jgi:7,8-dihydropterin-6-yl-methyl-4-(beta-D-ribofuranosyl)aminobenzene 5'-phosphate synthase
MRFIALLEIPPEKIEDYIQEWKSRVPEGDKIKIITPPHTLAESYKGIQGFVVFETEAFARGPMMDYLSKYVKSEAEVKLFPVWKDAELAKELIRFREGKKKAEYEYRRSAFKKMKNLGATRRLEILPLIDWHTRDVNLKVENGVSYLVKTDENSILFDLGLNGRESEPSPLLHNMNQLGITMDDFDTIVISHNHADHIGGGKWLKRKTFSITANQIDLKDKKVYTPVRMTYPGLKPIHSKRPTVIGNGVATIGTISNPIFFSGMTPEQALAVNVEGKGIVLVVGCGHQTLPKIIERAETLFDEPIYGLIGGLHYPVEGGPIEFFGMSPYQYIGTGKVPWSQITSDELLGFIDLLKKRKLGVVGLSAHDSSNSSLEAFHEAFPAAYREVMVGEPITI